MTDDEIKDLAYAAGKDETGPREFSADLSWILAFARSIEAAERERWRLRVLGLQEKYDDPACRAALKHAADAGAEAGRTVRLECRLCGARYTATLPWRGRPQGPQCQCNPNTWGNWKRVDVGALREGCNYMAPAGSVCNKCGHVHEATKENAMEGQGHQAMWPQMIKALAEIDAELGLPEDGCNSLAQTLASIRALKAKAEIAQAMARTAMAGAEFEPLRARGVVDADGNLDCWDTDPFEICRDHVAALNEKDPAAMWRVVELYGRDLGRPND